MDADKSFFTVGEISDITGVSKQAIRYYDRIGLLKPGKVDAQNSYRYYEPMHVLILNTIMRLSQLGCSLKEIKAYISGSDIKGVSSMLEVRRLLTNKKIAELSSAVKTLEDQISMIEQGSLATEYDKVILRDFNDRYFVYTESGKQPGKKQAILQINHMIKSMDEFGSLFICSPVFEYKKEQGVFRTGFFYDETPDVLLFPVDIVPAGTYACVYHKGNYENIDQSANKIYEFIKHNRLETKSNLFQLHLIDYALTQNDDELITELQIRVNYKHLTL